MQQEGPGCFADGESWATLLSAKSCLCLSTFCFSSSFVKSLGKQSVPDGYILGLVRFQ